MDFEILDSLDISKNPEILQDSRDNRNSDIQIPEKANMKSHKKKFAIRATPVRTARNVFVKKFFYDFSTEAKHAIFLSELETPKSLKCPKKIYKDLGKTNQLFILFLIL